MKKKKKTINEILFIIIGILFLLMAFAFIIDDITDPPPQECKEITPENKDLCSKYTDKDVMRKTYSTLIPCKGAYYGNDLPPYKRIDECKAWCKYFVTDADPTNSYYNNHCGTYLSCTCNVLK